MDILIEVNNLLEHSPSHKVEDFEIIDIALPIKHYEEVKEELFDRGYEITEAEYNNIKYLEVIRGGETA